MSEIETLVLKGKFSQIIYHNETNHYTVARFVLYQADEKSLTVTGYFSEVDKDDLYNVTGHYTMHPKYGHQFVIDTMEKQLPEDSDSILSYLSGPVFPGIGPKYAQTILTALGDDCLMRIRENPEILNMVPKMTEKKKKVLEDGICSQDDLQEAIMFFSTHGLGIRNIMRLDRKYGKDVLNVVKENPYRLVEEVDGIGFKTADKLALSMGIAEDDPRRILALVLSLILEECVKEGDSYIRYDDLELCILKEKLDIDLDDVLNQLVLKEQIFIEEDRIYHYTQYQAETFIASYLNTPLAGMYKEAKEKDVLMVLDLFEKEIGIKYDETQVEAIKTFFKEDVMILTGGPGTGKTTVVRAMVEIFRQLNPYMTISVCAPTGRAAKRLTELTGVAASTIHSLLHWDLETNTFTFDDENPLNSDLVIIDESSMVDQWVFYHLLLAGPNFKKLLIIGDEDQLPSVGIGAVLRDLIEAKKFPLVRLNRIFRQKEGSGVITLAHGIIEEDVSSLDEKNDVLFIECSRYQIKDLIVKLVNNALEKGYDVNDIQVLSPKYSGVSGIDELNLALQKSLNPHDGRKREIKSGYRTFREGDKILQLKNQPNDDVYNGDIGILQEIIYANEEDNRFDTLIVDYDGIWVEYIPENFTNIAHAYCVSVHKAQGSEYPIVIMPIVSADSFMLTKRLIYTGITRASKSLILLGERDALEKGICQKERHIRKTTLKQRLTGSINK